MIFFFLFSFIFQRNISWTVNMNMQMSELMMSSPQFSINFVHRNDENPIFQIWESKTCLLSTLNKCRIMFALMYFDMGTCVYMFEQKIKICKILYTKYMEKSEAMTSSTHSFAYSYRLFKKCFVENYENSKFHIFLILYLIYVKIMFTVLFQYFTLSIELT